MRRARSRSRTWMAEPDALALLAEARVETDRQLDELARSLARTGGGGLGKALGYALGTTGNRVGPARASTESIDRELLHASGIQGMVGGQWLALQAERRSLSVDDLRGIHARKTGALIRAGCVVGALAGGAAGATLAALSEFGRE